MDENTFFKYQVPKDYCLASLETCDMQPPEYIAFARQWALNPISVFLVGGYGTGKTQFAFAMIREMFRKNKRIIWPRFFTSPDLDGLLLHASKSDEGDRYTLRDMSEQDLLFIDDIGRETKSERLKRQYFEIINYRHSHKLPTILTSNYHLDKLSEIIDGSIASRMQQWQIIEFNGLDLRNSNNLKNPYPGLAS